MTKGIRRVDKSDIAVDLGLRESWSLSKYT